MDRLFLMGIDKERQGVIICIHQWKEAHKNEGNIEKGRAHGNGHAPKSDYYPDKR